MHPVKGYLTADGTFYANGEDARLHEATHVIKVLCESHKPKGIAPEKFMQLLLVWCDAIREFIDASIEAKEKRSDNEDTSTSDRDQADQTDGDALDEAVVKQSAGGPEHMPEVGKRTSSESIF